MRNQNNGACLSTVCTPVIIPLFHMEGNCKAFLTQSKICAAEHSYHAIRCSIVSHRPNHIDTIYSLKRILGSAKCKVKNKIFERKGLILKRKPCWLPLRSILRRSITSLMNACDVFCGTVTSSPFFNVRVLQLNSFKLRVLISHKKRPTGARSTEFVNQIIYNSSNFQGRSVGQGIWHTTKRTEMHKADKFRGSRALEGLRVCVRTIKWTL